MQVLKQNDAVADVFGVIFENLTVGPLMALPDHLRKTFMALLTLDKATAIEIANLTDRARAVESGYLNQLVLMGYAGKHNDGRKKVFTTGLDAEWVPLLKRMNALKPDHRIWLATDMLTALKNRLEVFERCQRL